jgi:hypothetical protein
MYHDTIPAIVDGAKSEKFHAWHAKRHKCMILMMEETQHPWDQERKTD